MLLSPYRLTQAAMAILNVEDRFNRRLKYPYVLFMTEDDLAITSDDFKARVDWITEGRATIAAIPNALWEVPDHLDAARANESLYTIGFSYQYRAMCRFFSGFFWRQPALAPYEWLWRLDTDISFHCDIPYDPIQDMITNKALYGFVQITSDSTWVQQGLASNVSLFLSQNVRLVPRHTNLRFAWRGVGGIEKALDGVADTADWRQVVMYNNFEISHRSVWESEIYTKFFEFLDESGGFFYERWGDAPVHSFGLAMSLRKDQVRHFRDLGYQHQGWSFECPKLERCACVVEGYAGTKDFNSFADIWFNPPI